MKKKQILMLIIAAQLVFLLCSIGFHSTQIKSAKRIILQTEPVDPFSMFRGRYVVLNYKISTVDQELLKDCKLSQLKFNDPLYVVLGKTGQTWKAVAAYKNKPTNSSLIYLKGKVRFPSSKSVRLTYGIESFFLSEKSADEIEANRRNFRTGGVSWRERKRQKEQRIARLDAHDRNIQSRGITKWWFGKLVKELEVWQRDGFITESQNKALKEYYNGSLQRIQEAESGRTEQQETGRQLPLTVEVAVTKDGRGYPAAIFWEGKEYR